MGKILQSSEEVKNGTILETFDPLTAPDRSSSLKLTSLKGALVTAVGQGLKIALQLVSQLVLARLLFPADFGLLAMAYPVIALVGLLNDIGIGESIIQKENVDYKQVSTLFWVSVIVSFLLCLIVMAAAPIVATIYKDARITPLLIVLALTLPLGAIGGLPASILTRQMRFATLAKIETGSAVVGLVVTLSLASMGASYWSLVAGQFAIIITGSAFTWHASRWLPTKIGRLSDAANYLRFGGNITAANLATFASMSADNIIVGFFNGPIALGYYDRSYRLTVQPVTQLLAPISRVALPLLSRYIDDPDQYKNIYLDMVRAVIWITAPLMIFCAINGRELVDVLLGNRWKEAGPIFQWIALGGAAAGLNASTTWLFVSQARTSSLRRYSTASALVHVASFMIGASQGIIYVAAFGAIGFLLITTPMMVFGATREYGVSFRSVAMTCLTFALPIIISIIAGKAIDLADLSNILDMIITGLVIGGIFIIFVFLVPSQNRLARLIIRHVAAIRHRNGSSILGNEAESN